MSSIPTPPATPENRPADPKTTPTTRQPGSIDDRGEGHAPQPALPRYDDRTATDEEAAAFLAATQRFLDAELHRLNIVRGLDPDVEAGA